MISGSKEGFFNNGVTTATFMEPGTLPELRDLLIIIVINGISSVKAPLTIHVGIGSSEQDLEGLFDMIFCSFFFSDWIESVQA